MTKVYQKSLEVIPKILQSLELGEIVALHTDMFYIFLAHGFNDFAVNKIHELKKWNPRKPLTLLSHRQKVEEFAIISPDSEILVNQFPYPISLIVPHKGNLSDEVTGGHKTIFLSCPDDFIYNLIDESPFPIVCGTASLGGEYQAKTAKTTQEFFGNQVSLIIDGGKCKYGMRTTMIDCSLPLPTIMNFGLIAFDELRLLLPHIELPSHLRK